MKATGKSILLSTPELVGIFESRMNTINGIVDTAPKIINPDGRMEYLSVPISYKSLDGTIKNGTWSTQKAIEQLNKASTLVVSDYVNDREVGILRWVKINNQWCCEYMEVEHG